MAIRLTKVTKIIFAVVIVILSVALGYLIWRVNQPETVAPTDSEAAGGAGACCNPAPGFGCVAGWKCIEETCSKDIICVKKGQDCPTYKGISGKKDGECQNEGYKGMTKCIYEFKGVCVRETDPEGPTEGECKDVKCTWPTVIMSDKGCDCQTCNGSNGCGGNPPTSCKLGSCPSGYEECGTTVSHDEGGGCSVQSKIHCTVYHPDCNNPSVIYRYCKPVGGTNVCDGGSWVTKPSGEIASGESIPFSVKAKDSDGIKKDSIRVELANNSGQEKTVAILKECTTGETTNCITISEASTETTISGVLTKVSSSNTLKVSWADSKDVTGSNCILETSFTVISKEVNPNWSITKGVVEQCIDEKTTNPKAELIYTITVKNTGDDEGRISKIEDVLDSKVKDTFVQVSTITSPGIYASGKISWSYAIPLVVEPNSSKVFTYKLIIDKENFGTYSNKVTLTTSGGDTLQAVANITADCEIVKEVPPVEGEVPKTGIFDSTASKIAVGFSLIFVGIFVYNMPHVIFVKDKRQGYREKFEKRVAHR